MSNENANSLTNSKKKALGRGLGSLLGGSSGQPQEASNNKAISGGFDDKGKVSLPTQNSSELDIQKTVVPTNPENKVWTVAIDKLASGIYQPRKTFEKQSLQDLAQSIRENGILQPIVARRTTAGKLEIVAGERRWRAAQLAGMHEVPVILRTLEDKEALELAIVENIQREDLNPIEEAEGYQRLIQEFHLSQSQVADKVGRERATVANALRLLNLSPEVRAMVTTLQLSAGHAKVLLALSEPKQQLELAKRVVFEKMPVRRLEKLIGEYSQGKKTDKGSNDKSVIPMAINNLAMDIQKWIGTKVSLEYSSGKGRLVIHFYSNDELNEIAERIKIGCKK